MKKMLHSWLSVFSQIGSILKTASALLLFPFAICVWGNLCAASEPAPQTGSSHSGISSVDAVGPRLQSDDSGTLIALVNGVPITKAQLDAATSQSGQPDTWEFRQKLKQQLIGNELLRQAAEKAGFSNHRSVKQPIRGAKFDTEINAYLSAKLRPNQISDSDVFDRYKSICVTLGPQEYKMRIISVATENESNEIIEKLAEGNSFDTLADQYSIADGAFKKGAFSWISFPVPPTEGHTHGLPIDIAKELVKLKAGKTTSQPVIIGNLRVFININEKRPTSIPSFSDQRERIRHDMETAAREEALNKMIADLRRKAEISE